MDTLFLNNGHYYCNYVCPHSYKKKHFKGLASFWIISMKQHEAVSDVLFGSVSLTFQVSTAYEDYDTF